MTKNAKRNDKTLAERHRLRLLSVPRRWRQGPAPHPPDESVLVVEELDLDPCGRLPGLFAVPRRHVVNPTSERAGEVGRRGKIVRRIEFDDPLGAVAEHRADIVPRHLFAAHHEGVPDDGANPRWIDADVYAVSVLER